MVAEVRSMHIQDSLRIQQQLSSLQEQQRNLHRAVMLGSQTSVTPLQDCGQAPASQDLLAEKLSSWGRKGCYITVCCSHSLMLVCSPGFYYVYFDQPQNHGNNATV
jgi:hypothetical protein